jgi:hypothetical protein
MVDRSDVFFFTGFFLHLRTGILFTIVLASYQAVAQTDPLDKIISLDIQNERIELVLQKVAQQTGIHFSYNPEAINSNTLISFSAYNQPLRKVLQVIFEDKITYKVKGRHVILHKKQEAADEKWLILKGSVVHRQTGAGIPQASIYERNTFFSAITGSKGDFTIRLPANRNEFVLVVSKPSYRIQRLLFLPDQKQPLTIILVPFEEIVPIDSKNIPFPADSAQVWLSAEAQSWQAIRLEKLFINHQQQVHSVNIRDTLYRQWQASLLPYMSTNRLLGGSTIVNYSANLLAGYTYGVRKAEVGGFANLVRQHVDGVQVAGVGNLVMGNVKGIQVAGAVNTVWGRSHGFQFAGLLNYTKSNREGIQIAGAANVAQGDVVGNQLSGLVNVVIGDAKSQQVSGLSNITTGQQQGLQVSILNLARTVKRGTQIGFINYADSLDQANQFGFFSYVKKGGYRRVELSLDELSNLNLTFKTGSSRFYNIFTLGVQPSLQTGKRLLYNYGYGIGTTRFWRNNWAFDLTLSYLTFVRSKDDKQDGHLPKAMIQFEKRLSSHAAIAFGPSFTIWTAKTTNPPEKDLYEPKPVLLISRTGQNDRQWMAWVGAQLSFRLL